MARSLVVLVLGVVTVATACDHHRERVAVRCGANDFSVERLGWNGATGALIGRLTLSLRPGRDCRLERSLPARILWADGRLAVPVRPVKRLPGDSTPAAAPGARQVAIGFVWRNWCGRGMSLARKGPRPLRLAVTFTDGSTLAFQLVDSPRCDSPATHSRAVSTPLLAA